MQPDRRRLVFYKKESGGWQGVESSRDSIEFDEWQHVTGSFDAASGKLRVYIGGNEVASENVSNEIAYIEGNGFTGVIDDVKVHNRALSTSQVAKISKSKGSKPRDPGPDTTAPFSTLQGLNPTTIVKDSVYADPGASASDNVDETVAVVVDSSAVNTATEEVTLLPIQQRIPLTIKRG